MKGQRVQPISSKVSREANDISRQYTLLYIPPSSDKNLHRNMSKTK